MTRGVCSKYVAHSRCSLNVCGTINCLLSAKKTNSLWLSSPRRPLDGSTTQRSQLGMGGVRSLHIKLCVCQNLLFLHNVKKKILNKYFEFKPLRVLYFLLQFVRFCFDFLINFDNCKIIFQKMVIAWAWVTCLVLVHAVPFVGVKQEQSKHTGLTACLLPLKDKHSRI